MDPDHSNTVPDRPLPEDVAESFATALGLDDPPRTLADWADATADHLVDVGLTVGVDEMCLTDASRHEARVGDEVRHFTCVLDALLVPFVVDDPGTVAIRSRSPVSEGVVEATATRRGVSVDPDDAVMSFGVQADVAPPEDREEPLAHGYSKFCPYINAFTDRAAYETWDEETTEAVTIVIPLTEGYRLARYLGPKLTE